MIKVKLTEEHKQKLINNNCQDHVNEFGDCIGILNKIEKNGDLEIIWFPSNLKYHYMCDAIQIVEII